jgi:glycosyltransferase involved in cell wall biosynthesis
MPHDAMPAPGRVAILLSTYNGELFLAEQLANLQAQTVQHWLLYWRDDGSTDATPRLMAAFLTTLGPGRSVVLQATAATARAKLSCACCISLRPMLAMPSPRIPKT